MIFLILSYVNFNVSYISDGYNFKKRIKSMEKISPLRASLKAFEQFKAQRAQKRQENTGVGATNPFGLTFKGAVVQMDVFESQAPKAEKNETNSRSEAFKKAGKLAASAWIATKSRFNSFKQSAISFGNRIKENTINAWDKLSKTEITFTGLFKDSVSNLQKRPVSELETMFKDELQTV